MPSNKSKKNKKKITRPLTISELDDAIQSNKPIDLDANQSLLLSPLFYVNGEYVYPITMALLRRNYPLAQEIINFLNSIPGKETAFAKMMNETLVLLLRLKDARPESISLLLDNVPYNRVINESDAYIADENDPGESKRKTAGNFPIHVACINDRIESVKMILTKHHEALNLERPVDGMTPLHLAVINDNKDIVRYLIEQNCDIDKKRGEGTALAYAIMSNNKKLIRILVAEGKANLEAASCFGYVPLKFAVFNNDLELFKLLLETKPDLATETELKSVLSLAYRKGSLAIAKYVQKLGIQLVDSLLLASQDNKTNMIQYLLEEEKIDLLTNSLGARALVKACNAGSYEAVEQLINYAKAQGENVLNSLFYENVEDDNVMYLAFKNQHKRIFTLLLKSKMSVLVAIDSGKTILHLVFSYDEGWDEMIVNLLNAIAINNRFCKPENIIDINCKDDKGRTPLHALAAYSKSQFLDKFITIGANINCLDYDERSPLYNAAALEQRQMVDALLSKGADINQALRTACKHKNLSVIGTLLISKYDLDHDVVEELVLTLRDQSLQDQYGYDRVKNKLGIFTKFLVDEEEKPVATQPIEVAPVKKKPLNTAERQSDPYGNNPYANPYLLYQHAPVQSAHSFLHESGMSNEEIREMREEQKAKRKKEQSDNYQGKVEGETAVEETSLTLSWFDGAITNEQPEVKGVRLMHKNIKFYCPPGIIPEIHKDVFNIEHPKKYIGVQGDQGIKYLKGHSFGSFTIIVNGNTYYNCKITAELTTKRAEHKKNRLYLIEVPGTNSGTLLMPILFSETGIHKRRDLKALLASAEYSKPIEITLPLRSALSSVSVKPSMS